MRERINGYKAVRLEPSAYRPGGSNDSTSFLVYRNGGSGIEEITRQSHPGFAARDFVNQLLADELGEEFLKNENDLNILPQMISYDADSGLYICESGLFEMKEMTTGQKNSFSQKVGETLDLKVLNRVERSR